MLYCDRFDFCNFRKGQHLSGKIVLPFELEVDHEHFKKHMFASGLYRFHIEIIDDYDEIFACFEVEFLLE